MAVEVDSHVEAETLLKALLGEEKELEFVTEGGNGEVVKVNLQVAFAGSQEIRELLTHKDVRTLLERHKLEVRFKA